MLSFVFHPRSSLTEATNRNSETTLRVSLGRMWGEHWGAFGVSHFPESVLFILCQKVTEYAFLLYSMFPAIITWGSNTHMVINNILFICWCYFPACCMLHIWKRKRLWILVWDKIFRGHTRPVQIRPSLGQTLSLHGSFLLCYRDPISLVPERCRLLKQFPLCVDWSASEVCP